MRRFAPIALRCIVVLGLSVPFFWRLDAEEFHGDESHWTTAGQQAYYLVSTGQFSSPQWHEEFYFYSQPQIGKLAIGAALAIAGRNGPREIVDYDWQRLLPENRASGRVPTDHELRIARIPGALAGWVTCLTLWMIGRSLGAPRSGAIAAILLASHPLWLANSRRAGLDTLAICLALLACWSAIAAAKAVLRLKPWTESPHLLPRAIMRVVPRSLALGLLTALLGGLATGTKYVALLMAPLPICTVAVLWLHAAAAVAGSTDDAHRRDAWRATLPRAVALAFVGTATLVLAFAVFVGTNPAFYRNPATQLVVSVRFLTTQADDMRRDSAAFQSPVLVAAEIVDRAIWPTRFPEVVDHTLPDALVPGTYGTPVVALGAAAAIVALRTRWRRAPLLPVATLWTALVFVGLALSVPTWWERWHLPLIPPLCLLAGCGLGFVGQLLTARRPQGRLAQRLQAASPWLLAGAQMVAALAMSPTYLGRGFGALVTTPAGAAVHLVALGAALIALVWTVSGR